MKTFSIYTILYAVILSAPSSKKALGEKTHDLYSSKRAVETKESEERVREVSAVRAQNKRESISKQLEDPRWYCQDNLIQQPRESAMTELHGTPQYSEFLKPKLSDDYLSPLLSEMLDLDPLKQMELLDKERRLYPKNSQATQILGIRMVQLCLDNPSPVCAAYADAFLTSVSDLSLISAKRSCLLAIAYAQAQNSADKARQWIERCSEKELKKQAQETLSNSSITKNNALAILALAFSEEHEAVDKYARLVLSLPATRRAELLNDLKALAPSSELSKLTDCDLLRVESLHKNKSLLALLLSNPETSPSAMKTLTAHRGVLSDILNKNSELESVLIPQFLIKENSSLSTLEKELSPSGRQALSRFRPLIQKLPPATQNEFSFQPISERDSGDGSFIPPKDRVDLKNLLESSDWKCVPKMTTSRNLAKESLKNDSKLAAQWNEYAPSHAKNKLQEASDAVELWKKGKLNPKQLTVVLLNLQDQIPESGSAKESLRQLCAGLAPKEYQPFVKLLLADSQSSIEETIAQRILTLGLNGDSIDHALYQQLIYQLPNSLILNMFNSPNIPDTCLMSLGQPPFDMDQLALLAQVREDVLPTLIKAIRDESVDIRIRAIDLIGTKVADPLKPLTQDRADSVVSALITALKDPSKKVRSEAAVALGIMGEKSHPAIPALIEALDESRKETVPYNAAFALSKIGENAIPALSDALRRTEKGIQDGAAHALGRMGEKAVPVLITALSDENARTRRSAVEALAIMEKAAHPAVSALMKTLTDKDDEVRKASAKALGHLGQVGIESLIKSLADEKEEVRSAAAGALGYAGQQARAAIPALEKLAQQSGRDATAAQNALKQINRSTMQY